MIHRQYRLSARVILVLATFLVGVATIAAAAETFRNTVDGSELDLSKAQAGEKPDAVETFEQTGKNPLNGDEGSIEKGKEEFLVACAGCHGHHAKGKLGPSLIDDTGPIQRMPRTRVCSPPYSAAPGRRWDRTTCP